MTAGIVSEENSGTPVSVNRCRASAAAVLPISATPANFRERPHFVHAFAGQDPSGLSGSLPATSDTLRCLSVVCAVSLAMKGFAQSFSQPYPGSFSRTSPETLRFHQEDRDASA